MTIIHFTVCPHGIYGINCEDKCSMNCGVPERCDRVTGECEKGCQVGWIGSTCDTSTFVLGSDQWKYKSYMYKFIYYLSVSKRWFLLHVNIRKSWLISQLQWNLIEIQIFLALVWKSQRYILIILKFKKI